ncbi:MAG: acylphosphatase [Planctomycetota bacterium]|jgi:acylphosphatase
MAAAAGALHVWVGGRVQGVGFRAFTRARAEELGLSGWVRNLGDGRVEARATGEPAALEAWLQAVQQGPRFADVAGVEVQRDTQSSDDSGEGFRVLR